MVLNKKALVLWRRPSAAIKIKNSIHVSVVAEKKVKQKTAHRKSSIT